MEKLNFKDNFSLITAILPRESANEILNKAIPSYLHTDILISARGVFYKDKWYQQFTPSISPELLILEMLVPGRYRAHLMDNIAFCAGLHTSGIGAIYSTKCIQTLFLNEPDFDYSLDLVSNEPVSYKKNLLGIFCVTQKGKAEGVAVAAMRSGSPGPTITYGTGHGIRDKLGLLRIAISPEKEIIRLIVDNYDADSIFDSMVTHGNLHMPGMGFIYIIPVDAGLMNIPSIATSKDELANIRQIIKAIDELKGDSYWRNQGLKFSNKQHKFLSNLVCLTCVTERGKGDSLVKAAINAGAPGATITYGMESAGAKVDIGLKVAVNCEKEIIEMTVGSENIEKLVSAIISKAEQENNGDIYFYTRPVPKALTYFESADEV